MVLVIKVMAIALVISLLIKYVCVYLPITPSTTNALIGIFFPAGVMALLLLWRNSQGQPK
ncbi:hypothetical protein [Gloeocapsa sp. PCC 73106]|uniref:hypothetical protein n=1 Tax=Gloeocapsa sp. PCC 73106 TaxID=102232 RepID=UPI0002AC4F7C|nr:hypothetical protein [Gloeocapsa sp. PCC 73106]ELR96289.1 hypothetical protein GLO73106DRAFT_00000780 [Gloeocapsa sp. PCC 73106]